VLEGLRGEESISDLCLREGYRGPSMFTAGPREFLEAATPGGRDKARRRNIRRVKDLRREASLKEVWPISPGEPPA